MTDGHEDESNGRAGPEDRVEFRTWDPPESTVEKLVGRGISRGSDERCDVYLVGPDTTVNAKLRGSSLEVKRLVGTVGVLERWAPDPPAELPLSADQLDAVLSDLGIPTTGREQWSDRELLDPTLAMSRSSTGSAVPVRKRRQRYEIDGARAEVTEATFFDETRVTIAVEAADPDVVSRVLGELDLVGENRAVHHAVADEARQVIP